jgi:hypothetical protein
MHNGNAECRMSKPTSYFAKATKDKSPASEAPKAESYVAQVLDAELKAKGAGLGW